MDGTFEYVPPQQPFIGQLEMPPPPEQPQGAKFSSLPKQLRWGDVAVCPRCKTKTTRGRKTQPKDPGLVPDHIRQRKSKNKDSSGPALQDLDGVLLYRDPHSRKPKPCERCNGYGVIPNQGQIPLTPPSGMT